MACLAVLFIVLLLPVTACSCPVTCRSFRRSSTMDCSRTKLWTIPTGVHPGITTADFCKNRLDNVDFGAVSISFPQLRLLDVRPNAFLPCLLPPSYINVRADCKCCYNYLPCETIQLCYWTGLIQAVITTGEINDSSPFNVCETNCS